MIPALLIALVSVFGLNLPAKTLSDKARIFPRDAATPRSIFVVTFSKAASVQGSEWTHRLRDTQARIAAPTYQVVVLEDVPGLFRSFVISGLRRQVPQSMHDHFWVVATDAEAWQRCVDSTKAEEAHVFVLDSGDRVVWRAHGRVSDSKIQDLLALAPPRSSSASSFSRELYFFASRSPKEKTVMPDARSKTLEKPQRRSVRWTSFVASARRGRVVRALEEEGNPIHRVRVEHNRDTLLIHISGEDGHGWTTLAIDRTSREWSIAQRYRQLDAAKAAYANLYI